MNAKRLYDLWTETVGGGKHGHVHFDNLDDKDRFQYERLHLRLSQMYPAQDPTTTNSALDAPGDPPVPDGPGGGPG